MEHINYYNTNDIKYIYNNVSNYIKKLDNPASPKYLYVYGDMPPLVVNATEPV